MKTMELKIIDNEKYGANRYFKILKEKIDGSVITTFEFLDGNNFVDFKSNNVETEIIGKFLSGGYGSEWFFWSC